MKQRKSIIDRYDIALHHDIHFTERYKQTCILGFVSFDTYVRMLRAAVWYSISTPLVLYTAVNAGERFRFRVVYEPTKTSRKNEIPVKHQPTMYYMIHQ